MKIKSKERSKKRKESQGMQEDLDRSADDFIRVLYWIFILKN
jgi:hypothetical protein